MVGARARESTPAPPGCNITHGSPWPRSSYHIATVGSSTVGMSAPGARDERADMQRGGEGLDLAGAGVDLRRGVGELDDVLVAVVDGAVEHLRYRARPGREGWRRTGRGTLGRSVGGEDRRAGGPDRGQAGYPEVSRQSRQGVQDLGPAAADE